MASASAMCHCDGHSIDGRGTDHRRGDRLQAVRLQPGAHARLALRRRTRGRVHRRAQRLGQDHAPSLPGAARGAIRGARDHERQRDRQTRRRMPPCGARRGAVRPDIGMVFQHFNLWPHMSVLENVIEAPMRVKDMPKAEAVARGGAPAGEGRPRRQARCLSGAPLGRPAAARGHRPRARHVAQGDAVRRADLRARPGAEARGAGGDAPAGAARA